MSHPDLIVAGNRIVTPQGIRPGCVVISEGVVQKVSDSSGSREAAEYLDAGDLVVMPGLVDSHVHINEPGRTDWEGFETATRAAAAGGITTLVDMPLNSSPVTTDASALTQKAAEATGKCWVDYGFWGGVVPGNASEVIPMLEAGALGMKCFLVPSGLDEFRAVSEADLNRVMPLLAERNAVLLVHAELPGPINLHAAGTREYHNYMRTRPAEAEVGAVELMIRLAARHSCPVHIVHVSSERTLPPLLEARERGVPISAETCPHYLTFQVSDIPEGATLFKCAPPIRDAVAREGLWSGLRDGILDLIASDHSPCPPALKGLEAGDFMSAWGGISSLQLSLPAVWTEARERGSSPSELTRWMCEAPSRLSGLDAKKGRIGPGYDADLVIWDPDESFVVDAQTLYHRHKMTPYDGRRMYGTVKQTFLRGRCVFSDNTFATEPTGRWLHGGTA